MAGSGRRVFQPGEVLTASNVMNYFMDQSVMVFAGTAARGSAIGTAVAEGMVTYLKDSDNVQLYDGANWKRVYPSVANQGEVLQVEYVMRNSGTSTTSTTFVDIPTMTITITPKNLGSKFLVLYTGTASNSNTNQTTHISLVRNGVAIAQSSPSGWSNYIYAANDYRADAFSANNLDAPGYSAGDTITYKLQFRSSGASTATVGRIGISDNGQTITTLTVMEVAG